ncbi:DNA circularization protein [Obesumbacterium proteus]|uniref:Phage tail/DNA circulation protein n=1 Tax=Obesumbacterium proteus ATCC 12841 TaxID=1354268 RepID=A0AA91IPK3_9GAMM|nr:DNA circularization N-terminal domain-containing protein [Obesumbacterium proteus]AMO79713.1 multidrug DMT transporter permease [Obesumbacterium proteus]OAT58974.1 phage tail/DNA circulation protein [Obesumbacterium proteus ATCC 12841]
MSWSENMQDASFRSVRFDVINTRDSVERALAQHEYPYLDGADIEDMGAQPRSLQLTAMLWGDDYESRLQTLLQALDKRDAGDLIHPIFGSMPNMQVKVYQVNHEAENVDACTLDIQFIQSKTGNPFFVTGYPTSQADAIFNKIQGMIDNANTLIDNALKPLRTARSLMSKAKSLATAALNMVTVFKSEVTGFISSTTDFINYPAAFFSDLQSTLSLKSASSQSSAGKSVGAYSTATPTSTTSTDIASQVALQTYAATPGLIMSDWSAVYAQAKSVASLPVDLVTGEKEAPVAMPSRTTTADIAELITLTSLAVTIELTEQASAILSEDTLTAYMTPDDVETIVNATRQSIQDTIDQHRTLYAPALSTISSSEQPLGLEYEPVISALKDIALSLQTLGDAVINARPPLTKRTVNRVANLHLIAYEWYGDFSRADELQRLNPKLRDPNNLKPGDIINAYSE